DRGGPQPHPGAAQLTDAAGGDEDAVAVHHRDQAEQERAAGPSCWSEHEVVDLADGCAVAVEEWQLDEPRDVDRGRIHHVSHYERGPDRFRNLAHLFLAFVLLAGPEEAPQAVLSDARDNVDMEMGY